MSPTKKITAYLATARYLGEEVIIIDAVGKRAMINYGGPIWVDLDELDNIVWIA